MMQLDYTFERQIELERQAGEEIGWKLGEEEKLRELIRKKLRKAKTLEQIAEELEETPEAIRPLYDRLKRISHDPKITKNHMEHLISNSGAPKNYTPSFFEHIMKHICMTIRHLFTNKKPRLCFYKLLYISVNI